MLWYECRMEMSSVFDRQATAELAPLGPEARLERELEHLRRRTGEKLARPVPWSYWMVRLVILTLAVLFFWDVFAHAAHRTQAIRAYLYLRAYGDPAALEPLRVSGLFTQSEMRALDAKRGDYHFYFPSTLQAEAAAHKAVAYAQQLEDLHAARVEQLRGVAKLRYYLFTQFGVHPPTQWKALDPKVDFSS
jgi:hypothetical protein